MRRIRAGCAILLLTLGMSVAAGVAMERVQEPVSAALTAAARAADGGDWENARRLVAQARTQWNAVRKPVAALADHASMEEMESLFAELAEYGAQEEQTDFSAACVHLARLSDAMRQNHALLWWNIL